MDDQLKKLADLAINGNPGAPRFDPGQLMYAEINDGHVTFYLRTHSVAVAFDRLTADEAKLAQLYYRGPAGRERANSDDNDDDDAPEIDDALEIDDAGIDELIRRVNNNETYRNDAPPSRSVEGEARNDGTDNGKKKGLLDAIFYTPPDYVIKYRIILILVAICIALGLVAVNYLQQLPYNNDKNEAYALAMKDPALTGFIAGRDVSVETLSANYYDPVSRRDLTVSSNYMDVELQAWIFTNAVWPGENFTYRKPLEIGTFTIIVDLKNDTSSSNGKSVMQWPG